MKDDDSGSSCTWRRWTALALLAATAPLPLDAQAIRSSLLGARLRQPVAGALVLLTDSAGRERGRTLTDESGRVSFDVSPGTYRLRVLRIGYARWETPPVRLAVGDTLTAALEPPETPIELPELTVRAERRCRLRPEEGSAAATLWEEARKALEATELTMRQALYRFHTVSYTRSYRPTGDRPSDEERNEKVGLSSWPFASIAPESLAARGFVQADSAGVVHYYGPDLPVLFSEVFLSQHCFRVRLAPDAATDSLVGLGFEPVSGRRLNDVAGVLWLDRRSAELRNLEFRFTNLGGWTGRGANGSISFERLPSGAWVIRKWFIRAPIPRVGVKAAVAGGLVTQGGLDTLGVGGYREEGAWVARVLSGSGKLVAVYPEEP